MLSRLDLSARRGPLPRLRPTGCQRVPAPHMGALRIMIPLAHLSVECTPPPHSLSTCRAAPPKLSSIPSSRPPDSPLPTSPPTLAISPRRRGREPHCQPGDGGTAAACRAACLASRPWSPRPPWSGEGNGRRAGGGGVPSSAFPPPPLVQPSWRAPFEHLTPTRERPAATPLRGASATLTFLRVGRPAGKRGWPRGVGSIISGGGSEGGTTGRETPLARSTLCRSVDNRSLYSHAEDAGVAVGPSVPPSPPPPPPGHR